MIQHKVLLINQICMYLSLKTGWSAF